NPSGKSASIGSDWRGHLSANPLGRCRTARSALGHIKIPIWAKLQPARIIEATDENGHVSRLRPQSLHETKANPQQGKEPSYTPLAVHDISPLEKVFSLDCSPSTCRPSAPP